MTIAECAPHIALCVTPQWDLARVGEPFRTPEKYDFAKQEVTARIHKLIPIMLRHRLTPPPQGMFHDEVFAAVRPQVCQWLARHQRFTECLRARLALTRLLVEADHCTVILSTPQRLRLLLTRLLHVVRLCRPP